MSWYGDSRVRALGVAATTGVAFGVQLAVGDPGPVYVVPILLAAVWFGVWGGVWTAIACAGLYAIGRVIFPVEGELDIFAATLIRLVVYVAGAVIVGWLAESRLGLEREVWRRERELTELRTIQQTLAPPEPEPRPGLELATCYLPAQDGVAGDFYLVTAGVDDATVIAIGDVAGRGLEAAKRAWFVRTVLASSADFTEDPGEMLDLANLSLIEESGSSAQFVTAACLVYRPGDRSLRWSVAGHDSPILLDEAKPLPNRPGEAVPLGIEDATGCATAVSSLPFGSGLLLYTDGVTEARGTNGAASKLFGEERLASLVSELRGKDPGTVVERVRDAVLEHTGGRLDDDLCMLALRASPAADAETVCPPGDAARLAD